jgi:hypothetical protein
MTMPPVEETLRAIAERATTPGELPPSVSAAIRRRRHGQAARAALAVCIAVSAIVVTAGAISSRQPGGRIAAAPSPSSSAPTAAQDARVAFPPLPPPSAPDRNGEPSTLLASIGGGAERLAVVDPASGAVHRYVQTSGSQALFVFAPDLRTAYQWDMRGCRYSWTATNVRTGRVQPAFGGLGNVADIAFSPTGQRMAYVSVGRQRTVVVSTPQGHRRVPGGCSTASQSIVVTDTGGGATKQWQLPAGYDQATYLAFDPTATHVAFVEGRRVRILDLNRDAVLASARPLARTLAPGCSQHLPTFVPGTNRVDVDEWCGTSHPPAIVGYDVRTGREVSRHVVGHPGSFISYFAVDATGKHLVYSVDGSVYAAEAGGDRHIIDDTYQLAW